MSILHPEKLRRCKKCGHEWRAQQWGRLDEQQPILGIGLTRRSQDLARQTVHEKRIAKSHQYRFCPECGSSKVKTASRPSKPASDKDRAMIRETSASAFTQFPAGEEVLPGPAWLADPLDRTRLRYWDGAKWTDSVAPRT